MKTINRSFLPCLRNSSSYLRIYSSLSFYRVVWVIDKRDEEMGTGFSSSVFPTDMVDCKTTSLTDEYSTDRDARREYACTSDPKLRWPMTIVRINIM